ncbi:MAG TPA: cupredoxin domain-containing protein [Frankiaceae bacterium]|jgi:plastocyanin|nr:cupredoxin domain-containing protein [Frankiaceae bacterium]
MSRALSARSTVAAVALAVSISACGSHTPPSTRTASHSARSASRQRPVKATRITISDYAYQPAKITVASGASLTFSNRDQTPHTATGTPNGFDTGRIKPGQSKTITVSKPGTYAYYCQFHAFMHGTIIVR